MHEEVRVREPCPACELHRLLEAAVEQLLLVRIRGDHDLAAERMEMVIEPFAD